MRVMGELIYRLTLIGRDDRGRPIYEKTAMRGVIVPRRSGVVTVDGDAGRINTTEITLLLPSFHPVESGTQFEIRGKEFWADGDGFDHISPFGTGRGGTEVNLTREAVQA